MTSAQDYSCTSDVWPDTPYLGMTPSSDTFLEQQDMVEVYKLPYRDKVSERFMRMFDKFSMYIVDSCREND